MLCRYGPWSPTGPSLEPDSPCARVQGESRSPRLTALGVFLEREAPKSRCALRQIDVLVLAPCGRICGPGSERAASGRGVLHALISEVGSVLHEPDPLALVRLCGRPCCWASGSDPWVVAGQERPLAAPEKNRRSTGKLSGTLAAREFADLIEGADATSSIDREALRLAIAFRAALPVEGRPPSR